MKKCHLISIAFLVAIIISSTTALAQDIHVTFSGTGAATRVDSVIATNLATSESVSLPGNETLVLTANSGIPTDSELAGIGIVYPNPFSGTTALSISISKPQTVYVRIQNLVGQVVAQTQDFLQPGDNEFALTLNAAGIYWVNLTSEQGTDSYKVVCTEANDAVSQIDYRGIGYHNPQPPEFKSMQTVYTLGYKPGEIILYKCKSGSYTSILTDSPTSSKNYEVEFVSCVDPDGRNYAVTKIGDQFWMEENLAYLPSVSSPLNWSDSIPHYYVYYYNGTDVGAAKLTANYSTYGVLYNWEAAKTACPSGWYLPTDDEFKILEKNLGMTETDANSEGARTTGGVGKKLKSSNGWSNNGNGDNSSGLNVLPGGFQFNVVGFGGFTNLGLDGYFWSSSETESSTVYFRRLGNDLDGVPRWYEERSWGSSVRCLRDMGAVLPNVATLSITSITDTAAASGGNINDDGGAEVTARGICWSTSPNPTIDDKKTTDGTGAGIFTSNLIGLQPATPYYVKAYATNSFGTGYGEQQHFTTSGGITTDSTFYYAGRTYKYVVVGTQTWMAENLAYLPSVSPSSGASNFDPFYYVYGYEGNSVTEATVTDNFYTYGVLYNLKAAKTACPSGWHLPSDEEWKILEKNLEMSDSAADSTGLRCSGTVGGKLKESGTTHWQTPNTGATNICGFKALPGGFNQLGENFYGIGYNVTFWTSSTFDIFRCWCRRYFYDSDGVTREFNRYAYGFYIRCIKD